MVKLRAVFLLGTLKTSAETSNTHILSEFLANHFKSYGTESEIIRLADYNIKPGVYTNIDSDDWSAIFEKILDADIVIFAKLADAAKTKVMRILTPNFNFDDGIQR
jgi:multimeric flavodoxin WrbA